MKKSFSFGFLATMFIAVSAASSCKEETQQLTKAEDETAQIKVDALGPWTLQFADYFSSTTSFNNWTRTDRFDYNSSLCDYDANIPTIETRDNKTVLVISASKVGNIYKSGHVKSNYSFKPAVNEEFRVIANIKLVAQDGATFKGFTQTYGAWPAFWTVQETLWPTKGEIDIMEGYSYGTYARFASNLFYGTNANQNLLGTNAEDEYPVNEGWHKYEQYWRNLNGTVTVTIKVDDVTTQTYTNAIDSDLRLQNFGPHNIILNLNVGHTTGTNGNNLFNNNNINLFTKTMMWIDNVVVEKRTL